MTHYFLILSVLGWAIAAVVLPVWGLLALRHAPQPPLSAHPNRTRTDTHSPNRP